MKVVRDFFFALSDLQSARVRSEGDRTPYTAHLAADGAHAELIRQGVLDWAGEGHCATVTTPLEFDQHASDLTIITRM